MNQPFNRQWNAGDNPTMYKKMIDKDSINNMRQVYFPTVVIRVSSLLLLLFTFKRSYLSIHSSF